MYAGTAAKRLMNPISKNRPWSELVNRSRTAEGMGTVLPEKISCNTAVGTLAAITAKAIPRLSRNPALIRVDDIPDATPRLSAGVAFIIDATFGATNIPPPMPATTIGNTMCP